MNGRIYDPLLGRFLSADIIVQNLKDMQAFNRYGYVLNNPLSFTDPSGFFTEDEKEKRRRVNPMDKDRSPLDYLDSHKPKPEKDLLNPFWGPSPGGVPCYDQHRRNNFNPNNRPLGLFTDPAGDSESTNDEVEVAADETDTSKPKTPAGSHRKAGWGQRVINKIFGFTGDERYLLNTLAFTDEDARSAMGLTAEDYSNNKFTEAGGDLIEDGTYTATAAGLVKILGPAVKIAEAQASALLKGARKLNPSEIKAMGGDLHAVKKLISNDENLMKKLYKTGDNNFDLLIDKAGNVVMEAQRTKVRISTELPPSSWNPND